MNAHLPDNLDQYDSYEVVSICDVCGGSSFATANAVASVLKCQNCGFRFVSPRPTQEAIAQAYSRPWQYDAWVDVSTDRERLWRRRYHQVAGRLCAGKLLDVGAGLGTFLAVAREYEWTISGTEVSRSAIEYAKVTYGVHLIEGQLEQSTLDGVFDLITMWHVLEHVPEPAQTLRRCRDLLAPGGRLVVACPNDSATNELLAKAGRAARSLLGQPSTPRYFRLVPGVEAHLSHFTPTTIKRMLTTNGFDIQSIDADDAAPVRSKIAAAIFMVRRFLTRHTSINFNREMLVLARPGPQANP